MTVPPATHPHWSTRTLQRTFGAISVQLEVIEDFDAVLNHCIEMHPNDTAMIPYYAELWPSAEALATHIVDTYQTLQGKRVIELGCGLGLPSIICAKLGGQVTATDFHPHNRNYLECNANANGVLDIDYRQMDWASPDIDITFDVILGSDLLYESQQVSSLTQCIRTLAAPGGTVVLADPGRDHIQSAVDQLSCAGFDCTISIINEIFVLTLSMSA